MKHSVNVSLQPVKGGGDCRPVRLRVSWSGRRCDLSLGVSYNAAKWSKETGRARPNTRNDYKQTATEVNGLIEDAVRWVDAWFVKFAAMGSGVPCAKDLKSAFVSEFKGKGGGCEPCDLLSVFDRFFLQEARSKGWSENTQLKYSCIKKILAAYRLTAADFGSDFLQTYVQDEIRKGRKNATVSKNVRLFKTFAKYCHNNGFISEDVSKFDPHLKWAGGNKKAVIFLEFPEVEALLAADLGDGLASVSRDLFIFSCFSGLRFSDVVRLRKSDISGGKIYVVTKKTADSLEIELNKYTTTLFEKYKDTPGVFLFPQVSNQIVNHYLKFIFKNLGLCRLVKKTSFSGIERREDFVPLCDAVSFHAGRRTFVVECLRRGIAPAVVMKWTGHSDYSAMKPYIEIVDSLKSSEMSKFDA